MTKENPNFQSFLNARNLRVTELGGEYRIRSLENKIAERLAKKFEVKVTVTYLLRKVYSITIECRENQGVKPEEVRQISEVVNQVLMELKVKEHGLRVKEMTSEDHETLLLEDIRELEVLAGYDHDLNYAEPRQVTRDRSGLSAGRVFIIEG